MSRARSSALFVMAFCLTVAPKLAHAEEDEDNSNSTHSANHQNPGGFPTYPVYYPVPASHFRGPPRGPPMFPPFGMPTMGMGMGMGMGRPMSYPIAPSMGHPMGLAMEPQMGHQMGPMTPMASYNMPRPAYPMNPPVNNHMSYDYSPTSINSFNGGYRGAFSQEMPVYEDHFGMPMPGGAGGGFDDYSYGVKK